MRLVDDRSGIEVLSRDECLRLLRQTKVGRLVVVVGTHPHIVPVNYVIDGETIVFRTDAGTKLDALRRSPVAFEIDEVDPGSRTGWSVVVHGIAEEITSLDGPGRQAELRALPVDPWAGGEKAHWVRVECQTVSGRRVSPRPPRVAGRS